jgi:Domain of unknown function (DUF4129)
LDTIHDRIKFSFMAGTYQKDSFGWQLERWQWQLGEWWEKLFTPNRPAQEAPPPNLPVVPEWVWRAGFWVIAIALGLWVLWQLYLLLSPHLGGSIFARRSKTQATPKAAPPVPVSEWLQRSRQYAQRGNYKEACRTLYFAMIQKLDETGKLPNQLSRTDGEYLRTLQTFPNPNPYRQLIGAHEQLCFANAPLSKETYDRCDRAYQEIEKP